MQLSRPFRRRLARYEALKAREQQRAERGLKPIPFSGVYYPGESINPSRNVFTHTLISPLAALLMIQAAKQRRLA